MRCLVPGVLVAFMLFAPSNGDSCTDDTCGETSFVQKQMNIVNELTTEPNGKTTSGGSHDEISLVQKQVYLSAFEAPHGADLDDECKNTHASCQEFQDLLGLCRYPFFHLAPWGCHAACCGAQFPPPSLPEFLKTRWAQMPNRSCSCASTSSPKQVHLSAVEAMHGADPDTCKDSHVLDTQEAPDHCKATIALGNNPNWKGGHICSYPIFQNPPFGCQASCCGTKFPPKSTTCSCADGGKSANGTSELGQNPLEMVSYLEWADSVELPLRDGESHKPGSYLSLLAAIRDLEQHVENA